ncbi:MAG: amidohydrolase family protein [Bernardetiaceae bacterium]|nr:amidohydrolase family protein [Bernardetiaceae bacterium]
MRKSYFLAFFIMLSLISSSLLMAQNEKLGYINGIPDERNLLVAFKNATIYTDYKTKIEKATLLIEKGKVKAIGKDIAIPEHAQVHDLEGKVIYPAFVDLHSTYGMPEPQKSPSRQWWQVKFESSKEGAFHWNEAIKSEVQAAMIFTKDKKEAEALRNIGFGAVLSQTGDGIVRGSATLVALSEHTENKLIIEPEAAVAYAFSKGSSSQSYPASLMGSMALLRQTFYDAEWYEKNKATEARNFSLEAFARLKNKPAFFETSDKLQALRAYKLGKEFGMDFILKGNGDEYQRIDEIKNLKARWILPLDFPDAFDVEDAFAVRFINLNQMKHWELASYNPSILAENNIDFAFTVAGLDKKEKFFANLRKAIKSGLSKEAALKALTHNPAAWLGKSKELGNLNAGAFANFIITSGDVFEKKTEIYDTYVFGERYEVKKVENQDFRGEYELKIENEEKPYTLIIKGETHKLEFELKLEGDSTKISTKGDIDSNTIRLSWRKADDTQWLSGWKVSDKRFEGKDWYMERKKTHAELQKQKEEKKKEEDDKDDSDEDDKKLDWRASIRYPFAPYGYEKIPEKRVTLIKNTTVWTNEAEGILENSDVLLDKDGKIAKIGKDLKAPSGALIINGEGKHLTSGIIDEHSHIAIQGGVNDGVNANSSEVTIADVVNPEDMNIYRHLAGGVIAVQQLHGSANPIGGRSSIIKLHWGRNIEEMQIKGIPSRIKFALGENVKHSNWEERERYPQTRMGVEQVYVDAFTRALEYEKNRKTKPEATRRDLQMETMLEIIKGERLISCHSYVQSEINMLMKVAERFGFTIDVFTHILEGYKVADIMAEHGAGGSTFADWWAYKYEVIDAIPYNASMMHRAGVLTAINSDDAEMGRRLNQEAAKIMKYGGVPAEEALKMVTLNPAKMLKMDDRTGSIKVGKDADVVLWSGDPLSVYSHAEKTFVEGILYFDIEKDKELRKQIAEERNRLISKMLKEKIKGKPTQKAKPEKQKHYHCDDIEDFWGTAR